MESSTAFRLRLDFLGLLLQTGLGEVTRENPGHVFRHHHAAQGGVDGVNRHGGDPFLKLLAESKRLAGFHELQPTLGEVVVLSAIDGAGVENALDGFLNFLLGKAVLDARAISSLAQASALGRFCGATIADIIQLERLPNCGSFT